MVSSPRILDIDSMRQLTQQSPQDFVVHVYGMSYTGKNSAGILLASVLKADLIDEQLITEAIAYQITQKKSWYDEHIFQPYFDALSFHKQHLGLIPVVNDKLLALNVLKTKKVKLLSQKLLEDEKFLQTLALYIEAAIDELSGRRLILITNTALPTYFRMIPETRPTVHVLLTAELDQVRERFYEEQIQGFIQMNSDYEPDAAAYEQLEIDFEKLVLDRDYDTLNRAISRDEGIIIKNGYRIATDRVMPDTVASTILSDLYSLFVKY